MPLIDHYEVIKSLELLSIGMSRQLSRNLGDGVRVNLAVRMHDALYGLVSGQLEELIDNRFAEQLHARIASMLRR